MNREELSMERRFVLMTAVEVAESQAEAMERIVNNKQLNWGEVIYQMITHRTLNMFCYNLKKFNLFDSLEAELRRLLDMQWQAYHERNYCFLEKLSEILNAFHEAGLVVPILKGNLLVTIVYPALESRIYNDMDFLMKLEDVEPLTKVLESLGYIQGYYDPKTNSIYEAPRKAKMIHQMTSHEIQEFQKVNDNPFIKLLCVDVNYEILWKGNCPYKVDTRDLIARALPVTISSAKGYMLDYYDNIIQLCCHLYKEASMMMWITTLKDLKLYKFTDLYMYIHKFREQIDWQVFVDRIKGYNLEKIIYYNFYYVDLMFGQFVPQWVMDAMKPADLAYLDQYAIENKEPSTWEYDFFTRLFDVNRILSLKENETAGVNRFMDAKYGPQK
jgi:hypothetical protein